MDGEERPRKLVHSGLLFGIANFLKAKEGDKLFVCDREGVRRFELKLNGTGDVCLLDGKNLRVLDRDCGDLYLEGESVDKMDIFEKEREAGAPALRPREAWGFSSDVLEAVRVIVGGPAGPAPRAEKKNLSLTRLKEALDIISSIDRKYTVYARYRDGKKGVTIRFRNQNGATDKVDDLKSLGTEVRVSACFIDVIVESTKEEEREARKAGYGFTVIY